MGCKSIRASDISGEIVDDDKVVTVVVRSVGKLFDAKAEELEGPKRLTNVVELELRHGPSSRSFDRLSNTSADR